MREIFQHQTNNFILAIRLIENADLNFGIGRITGAEIHIKTRKQVFDIIEGADSTFGNKPYSVIAKPKISNDIRVATLQDKKDIITAATGHDIHKRASYEDIVAPIWGRLGFIPEKMVSSVTVFTRGIGVRNDKIIALATNGYCLA